MTERLPLLSLNPKQHSCECMRCANRQPLNFLTFHFKKIIEK
jgi:hypothetical protein